jgi:hypothetical protein
LVVVELYCERRVNDTVVVVDADESRIAPSNVTDLLPVDVDYVDGTHLRAPEHDSRAIRTTVYRVRSYLFIDGDRYLKRALTAVGACEFVYHATRPRVDELDVLLPLKHGWAVSDGTEIHLTVTRLFGSVAFAFTRVEGEVTARAVVSGDDSVRVPTRAEVGVVRSQLDSLAGIRGEGDGLGRNRLTLDTEINPL